MLVRKKEREGQRKIEKKGWEGLLLLVASISTG